MRRPAASWPPMLCVMMLATVSALQLPKNGLGGLENGLARPKNGLARPKNGLARPKNGLGRRAALSSLPPIIITSLTAVFDSRRIVASAEALPSDSAKPKFRRPPLMQYIAALGDPGASSGTGAETWGLWSDDPGPRGVRLNAFESKLVQTQGKAPAGWQYDGADWWLEEHGLIMPGPDPLPAKRLDRAAGVTLGERRYVVTGDRELTTVLTVHADGRWELAKGTLYDVTHLPCRSARYKPQAASSACSPAQAVRSDFPVKPGAPMPAVPGCAKLDYAVLFVVGIEA